MILEVLQSDNSVLRTFQVISSNISEMVNANNVMTKTISIQLVGQDETDFTVIISGQKVVLKDDDGTLIKEFIVEPSKFLMSYDLIRDQKVLTITETQIL